MDWGLILGHVEHFAGTYLSGLTAFLLLRKDVQHLFRRVVRIERHLGLEPLLEEASEPNGRLP